jgi:hypothetical protein
MNTQIAISYALGLVGLPYKWYRKGEHITGYDKFYAVNEPAPDPSKLHEEKKSIVCTGVCNLIRRHLNLLVPLPGTTDAWFIYLQKNDWLEQFDIRNSYPLGTLLLRNFSNIVNDQGHAAILLENQKIIHAYADKEYDESQPDEIVGVCGISDLAYSHYYYDNVGYYTHICRPVHWLHKN